MLTMLPHSRFLWHDLIVVATRHDGTLEMTRWRAANARVYQATLRRRCRSIGLRKDVGEIRE